MNFVFYYVIPFVLVLGVLIFFHELGHFLVAKFFKVKILKFSLGFGYRLLGRKVGETEYLISTVPLGGYVKMLGESEDESESVTPEEAQRAFSNKPVPVRIAVVAAGPIFNLLLAFLLFWGLFLFSGNHVMTGEIGQVRPGSAAEKAGLEKGDVVFTIQGKEIGDWSEIKRIVEESGGRPLAVVVLRGEKFLAFSVVPEEAVVKNIFGEEEKSYLVGIVGAGKYRKQEYGPLQALTEAVRKTWEVTSLTCLTIVKLFQLVIPIKTLGGPILIGQMTGQLAQESLLYLIPFMAVISINLAVLNLLPVPILDGGVIIFLLVELLVRRPISIRKRDIAQKVGIFLLALLMAVVFINDIRRLLE